MALAIVAAARERGLELAHAAEFRSIPGRGVRALLDGAEVWVGRAGSPEGSPELASALEEWEASGRTAVVVERAQRIVGAVALADTVKPEAQAAVAGLRRMGIDVQLLTGDNPRAAHAVAAAVGIEHVLAGVSPSGKLEEIARLQREGHRVGMVGDGVNDAAALTQADLGIAMGTGAGAAIEAADISVLSGDLRGVARALRLARETYTIVLQNLGWAFGYNLIALPLAMTGLLSPALAAVAMGLSSITVVTNSLRLRRFGAPGRPAPVRTNSQQRIGLATTGVLPAVLLGALVLGLPNTFAVPHSVSRTVAQQSGETLQLSVPSLRPGNVQGHLYLYRPYAAVPRFSRLTLEANSQRGDHATGTLYYSGPGHAIAEFPLTTGIWSVHIGGVDSNGRAVRATLTLPVN